MCIVKYKVTVISKFIEENDIFIFESQLDGRDVDFYDIAIKKVSSSLQIPVFNKSSCDVTLKKVRLFHCVKYRNFT